MRFGGIGKLTEHYSFGADDKACIVGHDALPSAWFGNVVDCVVAGNRLWTQIRIGGMVD
jgi:hypothetical protein